MYFGAAYFAFYPSIAISQINGKWGSWIVLTNYENK